MQTHENVANGRRVLRASVVTSVMTSLAQLAVMRALSRREAAAARRPQPQAIPALAVAATAVAALALGAVSIGRIAVLQAAVRKMVIEHLKIGTLEVDRYRVGSPSAVPA